MTKRRRPRHEPRPRPATHTAQDLGDYLRLVRTVRKMTLRQVQDGTANQVSNAYLSQIETGKIARPSPNALHALACVYGVAYDTLMEKAGYVTPSVHTTALRSGERTLSGGPLAGEHLTNDEEEKLLEYLAFLRGRPSRRK